jgi:predicted  nucleic acid-binding Zn-ribbon protein
MVHPDLELLRELQELDNRISELNREISYLPKHIAEIESRLEGHRRKLEADRASLTANQKERKRLEDDIKVFEGKTGKLRDQMNEAKTNEVYRAFQHEIEFAQTEIRKIEDRILDRMSEAETLDQNVKSAEAALKEETAEVEKEKKTAQQRTDADRVELVEAQARRGAKAGDVTPANLSLYERIRAHRAGIAVARVRDGRCTACNVILRLHYRQRIRSNEEVLPCEACGRILYYLPEEEAKAEEDAKEEAPKELDDCRLQNAEPRP